MNTIYNLIISNIWLYIFVIIGFAIITTILVIAVFNEKNRNKIKNDFKEAEKTEEELAKVEEKSPSNELENILKKMQEESEMKPEDAVKKFEEEQEEKAIISYQELVDNVAAGKIQTIDDEAGDVNFVENLTGNKEVMEIEDNTEESGVTPDMLKEAIESITKPAVKQETKQFKNSEIISPVYGVMDNNVEYPKIKKVQSTLDIMNTRDYNKLTEEIKKQEEFLNALIQFRNNL